MYIHVPTMAYPVKEHQIKRKMLEESPTISFGTPFVPPAEYQLVQQTQQPAYDSVYETLEETTPVLVEGVWVQQWSVREATRVEVLSRIPYSVTMRQGRLAMLQTVYNNGTLLDVIEAMLDSIPDPTTRRAARIDWEYAQEIKRDFPLVQQLTAQLGLTERQIDDLFVLAASL